MGKTPERWLTRAGTVVFVLLALGAFAGACDKGTQKTDPEPSTSAADAGGPTPGEKPDVKFEDKEPARMGPEGPALFILSGLKGYTEPCGCTLDIMLGGIDRIVGYTEAAKPLYEGVAFVDAGGFLFEHEEYHDDAIPQEKARVEVIIEGMKALGIPVTVPGRFDMSLGPEFYLDAVKRAEMEPLSVNAKIGGAKVANGVKTLKSGDIEIIVVGVNDPSLLEDVDGLEADEPHAALERALADIPDGQTPVVALVQGDLAFVKDVLSKHPKVDFGVVGYKPRMTDQVDEVGTGFTLEPYDQGRHLGILTLFPINDDSTYFNARTGSSSEIEKIEKRIEHLEKSLDKLPPDASGNVTPMALNLRKQIDDLEQRKKEIASAEIAMPKSESAFVWNPVALDPGYPVDKEIKEVRDEYNESLEKLNSQIERTVIPAVEGEPFFIGSNQCATCHAPANEFWQKTGHAHALKTLQDKDKAWDQSCIGCHVVGYEKPGGSVLGKLQYDAELTLAAGTDPVKISKDLRNVGCESCHGPGSDHRISPVNAQGEPHNIGKGSGDQVCGQCHVPDHSPRFDYDNYVKQITGPGHELGKK